MAVNGLKYKIVSAVRRRFRVCVCKCVVMLLGVSCTRFGFDILVLFQF